MPTGWAFVFSLGRMEYRARARVPLETVDIPSHSVLGACLPLPGAADTWRSAHREYEHECPLLPREEPHADATRNVGRNACRRSPHVHPNRPCQSIPAGDAGELRRAGGRLRLPYAHPWRSREISVLLGARLYPGDGIARRDGGAP